MPLVSQTLQPKIQTHQFNPRCGNDMNWLTMVHSPDQWSFPISLAPCFAAWEVTFFWSRDAHLDGGSMDHPPSGWWIKQITSHQMRVNHSAVLLKNGSYCYNHSAGMSWHSQLVIRCKLLLFAFLAQGCFCGSRISIPVPNGRANKDFTARNCVLQRIERPAVGLVQSKQFGQLSWLGYFTTGQQQPGEVLAPHNAMGSYG